MPEFDGLRNRADLARFIREQLPPRTLNDRLLLPELEADPDAPEANQVILYAKDNAGKTALMARFGTGSPVQIGIEP